MHSLDEIGMRRALDEAEKALSAGEIPVGAALYHGETLLWADHNRRESTGDPTAHAEILCLRHGSEVLGDWRLNECTLYVTLEPCPMCAGALVMSRVGRCVFGTSDAEKGCCGSIYDLPADPLLHGNTVWKCGIYEEKCRDLLKRGFNTLRMKGEEQ